jgi:hypothetical protein
MFEFLKEGEVKSVLENITIRKIDPKTLMKTKKEILDKYNPLKKKFSNQKEKELHQRIFKQERNEILNQKIYE